MATTPADIVLKQGDLKPDPPAAGSLSLYANTDGTMRVQNSAGVETIVGTGGSGSTVDQTARDAAATAQSTADGLSTSKANIASPTFTGVPAAPTPAVNTNTTQIATTAFVRNQLGSATPLINGTAAVGTSNRMAHEDHVHPTDTTRAAANGATITQALIKVAKPTANLTTVGVVVSGYNAGATTAQFALLYMTSLGVWKAANASTALTYPCRGVGLVAGTNGVALDVMRLGIVRNDAWTWTPNLDMWMDVNSGAMVQSAPTASGNVQQKVGFALSATEVFIDIGSAEYSKVA